MFGYENKEKCQIYVSKNTFKRHVDLLLIVEKSKNHYAFIKGFNTFMYDHTLHRGRKHFCLYYLRAFSTVEILKNLVNDCFRLNGLQMIKTLNMLNSKIMKK